MMRLRRCARQAAFATAVFSIAGLGSALAAQLEATAKTGPAALNGFSHQIAAQANQQFAALPSGQVRLQIISRGNNQTFNSPVQWTVLTFGRNSAGQREQVAKETSPTLELSLPAGWYVVHAIAGNSRIKHTIEVTAGRLYKYSLVKN